ncbi:MAG: hypothetical protein B7Y41_03625 [Hydrogenophilales bacterium 28-61-23]|nr:MAG: hypothetical protein B7Y41_03625 [Hydrogenophilales bacterium 28-61-23]
MSKAALFACRIARLMAPILGLAAAPAAHAISGASIELGHGVASTDVARIGARWDWNKYWNVNAQWNASGFWEASLGYLKSNGVGQQNNVDVGLTPVFRLRSGISRFYVEGGIGAHLLSHDRLNAHRELGGNLLFGDLLGFGWNIGNKDRYELGYRFLHYSNANFAEPNDGINLHLIRLGYNY